MVHPIGKYRYNVQWRVVGNLKMKKKIVNFNSLFFFFKKYLLKIIANQCHALFQFE